MTDPAALPAGFERLQEPVQAAWTGAREALGSADRARLDRAAAGHADRAERVVRALAVSEVLARTVVAEPERLLAALEGPEPFPPWTPGTVAAALRRALATAPEPGHLGTVLRRVRDRVQFDLIGAAALAETPLETVLRGTTGLADAAIGAAVRGTARALHARRGVPRDPDGETRALGVLALGKLGGAELNLSSDVDLVFFHGARDRALEPLFVEQARAVVAALEPRTEPGCVFRTDLRLRPFGDSGPLVQSVEALGEYYRVHGRPWERFALVRARPIAGLRRDRRRLLELVRDFVYRDYVDFGAVAGLRELRARMVEDVRRRRLDDDVKLGPGGIREAEFTVQLGQIVHAARHPQVRVAGFREALAALEAAGVLDRDTAVDLGEGYAFLRRFEHVLQAVRDEQTQQLPRTETGWLRAALALGFPGPEPLKSALDQVRQSVRYHFDRVLQPQGAARAPAAWEALWADPLPGAPGAAEETGTGGSAGPQGRPQGRSGPAAPAGPASPDAALEAFRDPEAVRARLAAERDRLPSSEEGRRRVEAFMPLALAACARAEGPDRVLERLLELVDTVRHRTVYLSLLTENPATLELLVELIGQSPWVLRELRATPRLLDRLRDPRRLFGPRGREALREELAGRLAACGQDEETAMETLREFASGERLSVGVSELRGLLSLTRSSDYLTGLAEVVLEAVLGRAWGEVHARHGALPELEHPERPCMLVVGYGKLGGFELGYGSDLDIVFLHPGFGGAASTGERPLAANGYLVRVAQKVIHQLTTRTVSGALYEVDTRLRPSGRAGLLVSSLAGFRRYQEADAWTWEHQALVRARPVAGPGTLAADFEAVREAVLRTPRDREALRAEVHGMRERMLGAAGAGEPGRFRLKTDPGGIVDIEFMVQYLVLGWASQHPELTRFRDNLRILETAADVGLLPTATADRIADAYRHLRAQQHHRLLHDDDAGATVEAAPWQALRDEVSGLYGELLSP